MSQYSREYQTTLGVDVGHHAAVQAKDTLLRVCETAPDKKTKVIAVLTSMAIVHTQLGLILDNARNNHPALRLIIDGTVEVTRASMDEPIKDIWDETL